MRYVRNALADWRVKRPDVQQGISTKLLMLAGNGAYDRAARRVPEPERQRIFKRDKYVCQICGGPADQIDHISNSSCEDRNLQAVCRECNIKKAFQNVRRATSEEYDFIIEMYADIAIRIAEPIPRRLCDDHFRWKKLQPALRSERQDRLRELEEQAETDFEDVDGYLWHAMQKDD